MELCPQAMRDVLGVRRSATGNWDFYAHFDRVYMCELDEVGRKKTGNAGRITLPIPTIWFPPPVYGGNFALAASGSGLVRLRLFQARPKNPRAWRQSEAPKQHIGIFIVRVAPSRYAALPGESPDDKTALCAIEEDDIILRTSPFLNSWETCLEIHLDANEEVVVLVSTYKKDVAAHFYLEASAASLPELRPLDKRLASIDVVGEWSAGAGGCMNHATWQRNPLEHRTVPITVPIGMYFFPGTSSLGNLTRRDVIKQSDPFLTADKISMTLDDVRNHASLLVLPATYDPGTYTGRFRMRLFYPPPRGGGASPHLELLQNHAAASSELFNNHAAAAPEVSC
ncbi:hypothetical protein T484DRAFT_1798359 [Baffinella frigidus]|nr:hypothetical protein T484DRAFT_1798359 [Cryptophyta sp. CCMP2293]